jgi:hypothetical protein
MDKAMVKICSQRSEHRSGPGHKAALERKKPSSIDFDPVETTRFNSRIPIGNPDLGFNSITIKEGEFEESKPKLNTSTNNEQNCEKVRQKRLDCDSEGF